MVGEETVVVWYHYCVVFVVVVVVWLRPSQFPTSRSVATQCRGAWLAAAAAAAAALYRELGLPTHIASLDTTPR